MITPNNRKLLTLKDPESINSCWIKQADYDFLSTATSTDIIIACSKINSLCNRKFNHQIVDQIFRKTKFNRNNYTNFLLDNYFVVEIIDMYLQDLDSFSLVEKTYNKLISENGSLDVLPLIDTEQNLNINWLYMNEYNFWIRYDSGYQINSDTGDDLTKYEKVPEIVKYATALMVKYMKSLQNNDGTVESFSTQTYSQKNSNPSTNSLLLEINDLLKDYKITKLC
jgi:hypothetical protein